MYNSELKTRFVREYTTSISTAKACESVFNQFEPYECIWNADLCTKNADDLQPVIDSVVGLRSKSKWSRLTILKEYVKWCIEVEGVPGACDGLLKIDTIGLEKIKKQMVVSPFHLQKYLNLLYSPESEKKIDNVYRCLFWLAYGGIKEDDALKIRCSDVDLQNMVIMFNDEEFPIYREAIPAFRNCSTLTQFAYSHPNYAKIVLKDRANNDLLIRGVGSNVSSNIFRVELSKRTKDKESETGMRLSYSRTWLSGVFYRVRERELIGEEPDFSDVVDQYMRDRTYKLNSGRNTIEAKKRQLAKDYMEDYERWKLAYKL